MKFVNSSRYLRLHLQVFSSFIDSEFQMTSQFTYVSDIFDPSMAGSMMLHIAYDIDVTRMDDPIIENAEKAVDALTAIGNTGSYLGMITNEIHFPSL